MSTPAASVVSLSHVIPPDFDDRLGNCYQLAASWLIGQSDGTLVHGTISSEGNTVCHAWVETVDGEVYEPIMDRVFSAADAARLFGLAPRVSYTYHEACIEMLKTQHYGPWDETQSGALPV